MTTITVEHYDAKIDGEFQQREHLKLKAFVGDSRRGEIIRLDDADAAKKLLLTVLSLVKFIKDRESHV